MALFLRFPLLLGSRGFHLLHLSPVRLVNYGLKSASKFTTESSNSATPIMSDNKPLVLRILAASCKVADQAGNIIRDILKVGDLGIVDKGLNDLQTQADRSAQKCIVASLSRHFPNVKIIGEENLAADEFIKDEWIVQDYDNDVLEKTIPENLTKIKDEEVVIWVDPVDGTAEYTQGLLDHVTVLIGVAVQGKALGGVIHQPYYNYKNPSEKLGRTIWGLVGVGAYGFQHLHPPEGKRILTTTRSHCTPVVQSALDALEPDEVLRVGGAGHKVMLLLDGRAHAYVFASKGCKKWDTCAPEAILHAVGGKLTDMHGNYYQYHAEVEHANLGGVLATYSSTVHDWYFQRIPQDLKDTMKN